MIKAAIFDLDGTLADTLDDLRTAMNAMLRRYGWPERSREELRQFINRGARIFVSRSMPEGSHASADDPIVTEALGAYSEYYAGCFNDCTHPFDGIPEALERLSADGIALAVLSNKQDRFVRLIADKIFPDTFAVIRGQGEYPEKPSPEAALASAREMGVSPEECAFIGDSDIDVKTALNAGMLPIGVSWGYRTPDVLSEAGARFIANTPSELADFIISKRI